MDKIGGGGLLRNQYNSSPFQLLSSVYPDYNWLPWKFAKAPNNIIGNNKRMFMDWVGKEVGVKEMSDWERISTNV